MKYGSRDQYTYRVKIDLGDSGDLVAAPTDTTKSIVVLSMQLYLASSQTAKLQSGGSTDLTGNMTGTAFQWAHSPIGHVKCNAGEKLNLVLGGTVQASGTLVYALVEP